MFFILADVREGLLHFDNITLSAKVCKLYVLGLVDVVIGYQPMVAHMHTCIAMYSTWQISRM